MPHAKHRLSRLLRLPAILALLLCLGCAREDEPARVAGGDDYPNGVEPLGKKSARVLADSADWNGFDSVPRSAPGMYDTATVPDTAPDTAGAGQGVPAPKRAAGASGDGSGTTGAGTGSLAGGLTDGLIGTLDTLVTRVLDTARGAVETVRTRVSDAGVLRIDSAVFVPADPSRPGAAAGVIRASRRVVSADSARVDSWAFADADGDGFLTARPGGAGLAAVSARTTLPGGLALETRRILAAGADLDFNAPGDNRLLAGESLVLLGGDTLAQVRLLDADGDSALIDFGKDSNLVDLVEVRRFAEGNPLVSVTRTVRIVASPDSVRNYPIRYAERREYADGSALDVSARGLAADSAFRAGEEALWTEMRFHAPGDSVARSARAWRVRLGPAPGAFGSNVLLGFSVEEAWSAARPYRDFHLDFRCESPRADGTWIGDGETLAWLTLPDGYRVVFTGSATAAGLAGRATGSDGTSSAVAFDRAGALLAPRP